ncbi:Uncharacterised protein [Actinomyces bovis]|uniref:Flp pilus assembly protein, pilin Flp n=2 Tax=Actinomyces bovis TaxID=1658 RepID=A0ABY1VNE3_9ACTO|nr:Uncharacterised protein [Actinomyces bovis]VEG55683.1 Uncharacterised protein [Actinomyces israelii]
MLSLMCTLKVFVEQLAERASNRLRAEEGASTVEWVVITGFVIVLAALVGRAIYGLVEGASSNLKVPNLK